MDTWYLGFEDGQGPLTAVLTSIAPRLGEPQTVAQIKDTYYELRADAVTRREPIFRRIFDGHIDSTVARFDDVGLWFREGERLVGTEFAHEVVRCLVVLSVQRLDAVEAAFREDLRDEDNPF